MSILVNHLSEEKKASLSQQLMAQFLIHDSEAAYLKRCLATGNLGGMKKQMVYYLGQYDGMLKIGSYSTWGGIWMPGSACHPFPVGVLGGEEM